MELLKVIKSTILTAGLSLSTVQATDKVGGTVCKTLTYNTGDCENKGGNIVCKQKTIKKEENGEFSIGDYRIQIEDGVVKCFISSEETVYRNIISDGKGNCTIGNEDKKPKTETRLLKD